MTMARSTDFVSPIAMFQSGDSFVTFYGNRAKTVISENKFKICWWVHQKYSKMGGLFSSLQMQFDDSPSFWAGES